MISCLPLLLVDIADSSFPPFVVVDGGGGVDYRYSTPRLTFVNP